MSENWLALKLGEIDTTSAFIKSVNETLQLIVGDALRIESIVLPTSTDAIKAWSENLDLMGTMSFSGKFVGTIEVPLPYEGVFLSEASEGMCPQRKIWSSWLAERPGVCVVQSPAESQIRSWRVGLSDGNYIGLDIDEVNDGARAEVDYKCQRKGKRTAGEESGAYKKSFVVQCESIQSRVEELRYSMEVHPSVYADVADLLQKLCDKETDRDVLLELHERMKKVTEIRRYDDLAHRQAVTFPIWLKHKLCRRIWDLRECLESKDFAQKLAYGLVPIAGRGALSPNAGGLVREDPENALDLISKITGIKRRWINRKSAERIPAEYRQNDESFDGRICPFETPESEMVGVQLQLARGAVIRSDGSIEPSDGNVGDEISGNPAAVQQRLGWGVSLIPFANHNDGARNMMGAKNLRQAVPVEGAKPPLVRTGAENELSAISAGAIRAGLCPTSGRDEALQLGRNLLVAYMPWYGWNVDDAIVVSDALCEKMAIVKRQSFSQMMMAGWTLDDSDKLNAPSIAKVGDILTRGSVIARLRSPSGKIRAIRYSDREPTVVSRIAFSPRPGFASRLEFEISRRIPLGVGDKLMGRHGNKGIVSLVLPASQMPRIGNQPVDILLNPHGVLSRKNPSQLLETHLGWLFAHGVREADVLRPGSEGVAVGCPDSSVLNHPRIRELLERTGLDCDGKARLTWEHKNGQGCTERVESDNGVVVGYQYFVRLDHVPGLKAQVRRGGEDALYSMRTGQAAHGRNVGGGQRVGEMEFWALEAHGAYKVIDELLTKRSGALLYGDYLRDWLRAQLIDFSIDGREARFLPMTFDSPTPSKEDVGRMVENFGGSAHRVTATAILHPAQTAVFGCSACGKKFWEGRRFPLPQAGGAKNRKLTVGNFLKGIEINGGDVLIPFEGNKYRLECHKGNVSCDVFVLFSDYDESETLMKATVLLPPDEDGTCKSIKCRGRFEAHKEECLSRGWKARAKWPAAEAIKEMQKPTSWIKISDFHIVCGDDYTEEVVQIGDAENVGFEAEPGGLYDPKIFGRRSEALKVENRSWGYIELPVAVSVHERSDRWVKILPVLPLRYRLSASPGEPSYIDACYQQILFTCSGWKNAKNDSERERIGESLRKPVANLLSMLVRGAVAGHVVSPTMLGKRGLIRYDGLGRRVDQSFRLVIAPNPELPIDEICVPTDVLWEVLSGVQGDAEVVDDGVKVCDELVGWSWLKGLASLRPNIELQYAILSDYCERNECRILLNRQPSLHKYSMMAFRVRPARPVDGVCAQVLQIPPLVCKGFAADFDGDEMVGIFPSTVAAQNECERMLPSRNLLSVADGAPVLNFDRDFVMGLWIGRGLDKTSGMKWLKDVCLEDKQAAVKVQCVFSQAVKSCTVAGVSFGFYDLWSQRNVVVETGSELSGVVGDMVRTQANGDKQIRFYSVPQRSFNYKEKGCAGLSEGMTWKQMFESSWNARKSMCAKKLGTGQAGDMTRRMVFALCGSVGQFEKTLIAAQSIGERGTQLSMKATHTQGRDVVDIKWARGLILYNRQFETVQKSAWLAAFRGSEEYKRLNKEHAERLWEGMSRGVASESYPSVDNVLRGESFVDGLDGFAFKPTKKFIDRVFSDGGVAMNIADSFVARIMFGVNLTAEV